MVETQDACINLDPYADLLGELHWHGPQIWVTFSIKALAVDYAGHYYYAMGHISGACAEMRVFSFACQATKLHALLLTSSFWEPPKDLQKGLLQAVHSKLHVIQKGPTTVQVCLAYALVHCQSKAGHCHRLRVSQSQWTLGHGGPQRDHLHKLSPQSQQQSPW